MRRINDADDYYFISHIYLAAVEWPMRGNDRYLWDMRPITSDSNLSYCYIEPAIPKQSRSDAETKPKRRQSDAKAKPK